MDPERKERIFGLADDLLKKFAMKQKRKKFVRYVKNLFHGEKNGKGIGKMFCTVVNVVKEKV